MLDWSAFTHRKPERNIVGNAQRRIRGATNESNLAMTIALTVPFLGTILGSSFVFFLKRAMSELVQKALLGFAAGAMIAASMWSLLIPAIENAESQGVTGWVSATVGFFARHRPVAGD